MKNKAIISIIILQVLLIIIIIIGISKKNDQVLGINSVSTERSHIVDTPTRDLKYFYQLVEDDEIILDGNYLVRLGYPNEFKIRYKLNSDGLNSIKNYSVEKPVKTFRIVAIGDSLTFGQNVNTEDNYPSQLEDLLNNRCVNEQINKFEVINLGVGGYDINYAGERFRQKGKKYDPDMVLWFIIPANFLRIDEEVIPKLKSILDEKKESSNFNLVKDQVSRDSWLRAINESIAEMGGKQEVFKRQVKYLESLNLTFHKKLLVFSEKTIGEEPKIILSEFSKSRQDIHFYDQIPTVWKDKNLVLKDSHPNKEGYTLIVRNLLNYLITNDLVPCN